MTSNLMVYAAIIYYNEHDSSGDEKELFSSEEQAFLFLKYKIGCYVMKNRENWSITDWNELVVGSFNHVKNVVDLQTWLDKTIPNDVIEVYITEKEKFKLHPKKYFDTTLDKYEKRSQKLGTTNHIDIKAPSWCPTGADLSIYTIADWSFTEDSTN